MLDIFGLQLNLNKWASTVWDAHYSQTALQDSVITAMGTTQMKEDSLGLKQQEDRQLGPFPVLCS